MSILEIEHVSFNYSQGTPFEKTALNDISLKINSGEIVGIIGQTGSGKSTLIQHFNGILRPQCGRVLVDGKDIWKDPEKIQQVRFLVGLMFQYPEYQLFEETVYRDVAYGPKNMGLGSDEVDYRVQKAVEFVGLDKNCLEKSPFRLSGGEMRRVAIAGILAMRPKVIVLDEPAAGLDPYGRDTIMGQIRDYGRETNTTVVIVSHSMEDIARWADSVFVMDKGKLVMSGRTEEIYAKAAELESIGLSIPQITKVFIQLNKRGIPVKPNIFTVDQAEQEMLRLGRLFAQENQDAYCQGRK